MEVVYSNPVPISILSRQDRALIYLLSRHVRIDSHHVGLKNNIRLGSIEFRVRRGKTGRNIDRIVMQSAREKPKLKPELSLEVANRMSPILG